MPRPGRYIDGVYNYCDRWCERCPLADRCRLYTAEQRLEAAGPDIDAATFWAAFDIEPPPEALVEEDDDEPSPFAPDDESWRPERPSSLADRMRHPLAEAGIEYGLAAHRWLGGHGEGLRSCPADGGEVSPADAIDVLRWYSLQIGTKLSRALSERPSLLIDDEGESWDTGSGWDEPTDELREAIDEAGRSDRTGSAKVAIIGIERSLGAWTVLRHAAPEHDAAILAFQRRLARLRRAVDEQIPDARTFVRPGFDDGTLG